MTHSYNFCTQTATCIKVKKLYFPTFEHLIGSTKLLNQLLYYSGRIYKQKGQVLRLLRNILKCI